MPTTQKQGSSAINVLIGKVKRNVGTFNGNVQSAAIAIIEHANKYDDCSAAARLVRALPPRLRPQLTAWLTVYSPISVRMGKTAKDDKCGLRKRDNTKFNSFNVSGATANPWFDYEGEETVVELTSLTKFRESVASFISRNEKAIEAGKVAPEDVTAITADLAAMHAMVQANGKREATPAMAAKPVDEAATG